MKGSTNAELLMRRLTERKTFEQVRDRHERPRDDQKSGRKPRNNIRDPKGYATSISSARR
jgi:hypothetical protein